MPAPKVRPVIVCKVRGCERVYPPGHPREGRRIPFKSKGALGSHRRRAHGLAALGNKPRRTPGTRFACDFPGCTVAPYDSLSGLGSHKNKTHGIISDSPAARSKAEYRERQRPPRPVKGYVPTSTPPPRANGFPPFEPDGKRPKLTPAAKEYIRLQVLYLLNGNWAKVANVTPAEARNYLAELCASNFAPPKHKTTRVATVNAYSRK